MLENLEPRLQFSVNLISAQAAILPANNQAIFIPAATTNAKSGSSSSALRSPSNLTATSGPFGITLNWTDRSTAETGFRIQRAGVDGIFTSVGAVGQNLTTFLDTTVSPSTSYTYRVVAFNTHGTGLPSATVSAALPASAAPSVPTNVNLTVTGASTIVVSWTGVGSNVSGYQVYRSADGGAYSLDGTVGANSSTFTDTTVAPGVDYQYEVAAWNAAGQSLSAQNEISILSAAIFPLAPSAPKTITTSNVTSSGVTLSWINTASNATGYNIYTISTGGTWTLVGQVPSTTTSFTDSGLSALTNYAFAVSTYNGAGETIAPAISVTTSAVVVPPPAAPSGLTATNVSTSGLTLNWTDNSNNETGFHIYRSNGTTYSLVATFGANVTTWSDSGLAASTAYTYYVGAYNGSGETTTATLAVTTATPVGNPVTFSTQNETSFTELVITGTSGNDSIYVTQSNGVLTIVGNGQTSTMPATYGNLIIHGGQGNDTITVDSSVTIPTLIYGGDGNDVIENLTQGKATIVTIGAGTNTVTGNGINTSYWVNSGDTVNASATEIALGGINRVSNFYQPWSTDPTNSNYISRELNSPTLADPTDSGQTIVLTNSSFWGTGAQLSDVNQGFLADCYFVGPLSAIAESEPVRLENMGVDLGDGTYAVRFMRGGIATYVRVNGDLSVGPFLYGLGNTTPGASGNEWASIFEKAYAFFRSGANTYASINWGAQSNTFTDLGMTASSFSLASTSASTALSTINAQLAAGHAVVIATKAGIASGAPLIESHIYTVVSAYLDGSGNLILQLYNPWGIDGFNDDSNPNDGLVTLSYTTVVANATVCNFSTV